MAGHICLGPDIGSRTIPPTLATPGVLSGRCDKHRSTNLTPTRIRRSGSEYTHREHTWEEQEVLGYKHDFNPTRCRKKVACSRCAARQVATTSQQPHCSRANSCNTDTRPRQPQCLRDPHACFRDEALDFEQQPRTSASHDKPCTNNLRLAHVPRAWATLTTRLPAIIIRR